MSLNMFICNMLRQNKQLQIVAQTGSWCRQCWNQTAFLPVLERSPQYAMPTTNKSAEMNGRNTKSPPFKAPVVLASLLLPIAVSASTYNELGDSGQTLATAQAVAAGVDKITGYVSGDADLFQFMWAGGSFYVDTVGSNFDTMLFLFGSTGVGLLANDDGDDIGIGTRSYLQLSDLAAGSYYIGVSQYNYVPYSTGGMMFQTPGNPASLDHWAGNIEGWGGYSINFRQATADITSAEVPGPVNVPDGGMTFILLGVGMSGVAWARRNVK